MRFKGSIKVVDNTTADTSFKKRNFTPRTSNEDSVWMNQKASMLGTDRDHFNINNDFVDEPVSDSTFCGGNRIG